MNFTGTVVKGMNEILRGDTVAEDPFRRRAKTLAIVSAIFYLVNGKRAIGVLLGCGKAEGGHEGCDENCRSAHSG